MDQKQLAEELTEKARRESASLRDSLVDMAAAEERLKQQLEEAQVLGLLFVLQWRRGYASMADGVVSNLCTRV